MKIRYGGGFISYNYILSVYYQNCISFYAPIIQLRQLKTAVTKFHEIVLILKKVWHFSILMIFTNAVAELLNFIRNQQTFPHLTYLTITRVFFDKIYEHFTQHQDLFKELYFSILMIFTFDIMISVMGLVKVLI